MTPPRSVSTGRTVAIVLAAGLGTRMKSRLPKVLHPLCGRPMLAYVLDAWAEADDDQPTPPPIVVYSPATAGLRDVGLPGEPVYALQEVPNGTADAVRAGLAAVPEGPPRSSSCPATSPW